LVPRPLYNAVAQVGNALEPVVIQDFGGHRAPVSGSAADQDVPALVGRNLVQAPFDVLNWDQPGFVEMALGKLLA